MDLPCAATCGSTCAQARRGDRPSRPAPPSSCAPSRLGSRMRCHPRHRQPGREDLAAEMIYEFITLFPRVCALLRQSLGVGGVSLAPSSARKASTTRSNCASHFALLRFQPVKSAASRDLICCALPLVHLKRKPSRLRGIRAKQKPPS